MIAAILASWFCAAAVDALLLPPSAVHLHPPPRQPLQPWRKCRPRATTALGYGRFLKKGQRGDDENLFRGNEGAGWTAGGERYGRERYDDDDDDEESYRLAREMAARRGLDVRDERGGASRRGGPEPGFETGYRRGGPDPGRDRYDDLYEGAVARETQTRRDENDGWGSGPPRGSGSLKDIVDRAPSSRSERTMGNRSFGRAPGGEGRYQQPMPPRPPPVEPPGFAPPPGGGGRRSTVDEARYAIERMERMQTNNQRLRPPPPPPPPPMQQQYSRGNRAADQLYRQQQRRQPRTPQPPMPPPMARPPANFNYSRDAYKSMPPRPQRSLSEVASWVDPPPMAFEGGQAPGGQRGGQRPPQGGNFEQPSYGQPPYRQQGQPPYNPYGPQMPMRPIGSVPLSQLAVQPNIEPVDRVRDAGNPSAQSSKLPFTQMDPSEFRQPYQAKPASGPASDRSSMPGGNGSAPGATPGNFPRQPPQRDMGKVGFQPPPPRWQQQSKVQHPGVGPNSNSGRPMPFQQIDQADFRQPYQERPQPSRPGAPSGGARGSDPRGGAFGGGAPPPGFDRPPPPGQFGEDDPFLLSPFAVPPIVGMPPPPNAQKREGGIRKEKGDKVPKDPFSERRKREQQPSSGARSNVAARQEERRPREPQRSMGRREERTPRDPFSQRQQSQRPPSSTRPNGSQSGGEVRTPKDPFATRNQNGQSKPSGGSGFKVPKEPTMGNRREGQQSRSMGYNPPREARGDTSLRGSMGSSSFGDDSDRKGDVESGSVGDVEDMSYEEYSAYFFGRDKK